MYTSRINNWEFNQNKWVVSLVNTEESACSKIFGHALIVVEGILEDGSGFIGEYDITANAYPEEQDRIQGSLGNTQGYIPKIRCNPPDFSLPNDRIIYVKKVGKKILLKK